MKKVAILTVEGSVSVVITGAIDTLNVAGNRYIECLDTESTENSFFEIDLISLQGGFTTFSGDIKIGSDVAIVDADDYDIVIVPQIRPEFDSIFEKYDQYISWIRKQYNEGADIFGICTGSFLIAEAGILNHKPATTHWNFVDEFVERYPEVNLQPEEVITSFDRIHCSAGSSSFLNLLLYMIEIYCGHEIAVFTSKMLLIDMDKSPQHSYRIFRSKKNHGDSEILDIQKYIEKNIDKKLTVDNLADTFYFSNRSFHRKFKEATGLTPLKYIQSLRIEFAKRKLENNESNLSAICNGIGYRDVNYFRELFKKHTGLTPLEYKNKYSIRVYPKEN